MISLIYQVDKFEDEVTVKAVVEDMVQVYPATMEEPAEYGPALCIASFTLDEEEVLPENEDELIDYLEKLDLDWEIVKDEWD